MRRRSIQAPLAILLLTFGVLLSATIDLGTTDQDEPVALHAPLDAPLLTFQSLRGHLEIEGTTRSTLHESGLLALAADHFDDVEIRTRFQPGVIVAERWETTSTRLLYVLAATESAEATMRDGSIEIRGVTADAETFSSRLSFLREELTTDIQLDANVISIKSAASHDSLCEKAFSQLLFEPISFRKSSAEIRTSSYGTLDRIIDFAYNCPRTSIAITGHTDASGNETWNRRLSLARAQAIADHIVQGGIDPRRLSTRGLGSSEPIADNSTANGRDLNRRIEIELQ